MKKSLNLALGAVIVFGLSGCMKKLLRLSL